MNFTRRGVLPRSSSTVSNPSTGTSTDNKPSSESTFENEVEDEEKNKYKRKTRNLSEKKRRDQFNMLINELCSMVSTTNRKMDKSTVLKSTIAFLKNYQEIAMQSQVHEIKEDWKPSFLSNNEFTQLMLEALDSFLLVFTQQGSILYASESITSLLGHLPKDLASRSLYDFIHDTERASLYNLLLSYQIISANSPHSFESDENQVSFMCHLKRGAAIPVVEDVYEYVKVTGNLRRWAKPEDAVRKLSKDYTPNINETSCFCCTVQLQPCQLIREMSNIDDSETDFTSRHSFEWKFLFLDHRASPIIGYLPFEVLGTSGYDYYHPDDLEQLAACHTQLMQAGEGTSCYYRFLTKGQQWIWLKTRYYITYHQWNSKPEFIVCSHRVISYADVRMHMRKEHGFAEEDVETTPVEHEKSCASSSFCQTSSTWPIQHSSAVAGSSSDKNGNKRFDKPYKERKRCRQFTSPPSSDMDFCCCPTLDAGHVRILTDEADTAEKPHSTLEEQTVPTVLPPSQMKTKKKKAKVKHLQPLQLQQQLPLPQLQPQLLPRCQPQLVQIQQQQLPKQQTQQQPPAPQLESPLIPTLIPTLQAAPSTEFQQNTPSLTQQQQQAQQQIQQQAQQLQQQVQQLQQQAQQQLQQQVQQLQQQAQQQQQAQKQQQQQQAQKQQQQQQAQKQQQQQQAQKQQQQAQQQLSPQESHSPVPVLPPQPPPPPPPPQQQQCSPSTSKSQLPPVDLSSHKSLTIPGMMMMMTPPTIPTTDLETVQVSSDLQISTVLNQGQPTLAVSGLSLPQGLTQTSPLFMTPAQRQLHKQLQFKSQQLQQTILRQQEELRQITEELALAHQFMPIADSANSGAPMIMMNPASFTSPTTEIPSTSSTTQFSILPQPITIQQPVQQQFLPFQILPTSHGQILCQSSNSNPSTTTTRQ